MRTYGKLREEIGKKFSTLEEFSKAAGIIRGVLSNKLNSKTPWKSTDIEKVCKALDISIEEVGEYFFY